MDYRQVIGYITGKPSRHPYPEHMDHARQIAADGMVLLKNDNNVLPLSTKKIALFGAGACDTISCGTGSGYVYAPYTISVEQGLVNAGIEITSASWLNRFKRASRKANKEDKTLSKIDRMWSGMTILIDDLPITDEDISQASAADAVIYVIRRNAGEGGDRKAEKGDYYLSDIEEENIRCVASVFKKVIVVLNTCVIDAKFLFDIKGIDAAVLMGLAGNEGGNALADILTGKVNPSGKLTDTWAKKYSDNPASATFGENDGESLQEDYCEDIYVGYRYFDSFGVEPLFPFGYGLSYTSFRYEFLDFKCNWDFVEIDIHVMNIGKKAGRDVVQVYVTAPNGRLPKPYQELRAYTKTSLINPGQSERIKLIFKTESMASYDESQAAYVMEQGNYNVRLGRHSRDTDIIQIINLDRETIVRQLRNLLKPDRAINLLQAPECLSESVTEAEIIPVSKLISAKCEVVDSAWDTSENDNANKILMGKHKPAAGSTLLDVAAGLVSIERFVSSLEVDVLLRLVTGHANETSYKTVNRMKKKTKRVSGPSSSGATTSLFVKPLGIPNWLLTDGPAGLHLPLCGATCYPVGMVIAQTWDDQAGIRMGSGVGLELKYYNHSVILGPGLNIHRDPLCGRNFEYFSEDPLISGKTAAAVTKGVQSIPGTSVSIKHFACNNQEENRYTTNSTVSERALREIYLKGFEICVRESNPNTVMTSYNKINGVHASSNYELLTEVLRGEWGFEGLVMTDWGTRSNKALDLHAGNDLIMGGYRSDYLKAAMEGRSPEFAPDGYVRSESFKVYGGFMTENVEYWNVFEPDSNGSDTVSTIVQPDIELDAKIAELVEADIATVYVNSDGSKTVTYRGRNRGAYLPLEDVQVCAVRVLTQIMNSVSYEVMMNRFK